MIANVQLLRAIAALLVVFVHLEIIIQPYGITTAWREAFAVGVDLFFVISGFVMVHTTSTNAPSSWNFFLNRVARVAPIYWILTILTFAVALFAPSLLSATRADVGALVKSLMFIPFARDSDGLIRPILFVGWTLNCEMFFYSLFSLGLLIRNSTSRVVLVSLSILILVLIGPLADSRSDIIYFLTSPRMLEFPLGMLVGLAYPLLPSSRYLARISIILLPILLILLVGSAGVLASDALPVTASIAVLTVLTALILEKGGVVIRSRLALSLGAASYSLYLIHPFAAQLITKMAQKSGALTTVTSAVFIGLVYILSCILAILLFRFVEAPLSRSARRLLGVNQAAELRRLETASVSVQV